MTHVFIVVSRSYNLSLEPQPYLMSKLKPPLGYLAANDGESRFDRFIFAFRFLGCGQTGVVYVRSACTAREYHLS